MSSSPDEGVAKAPRSDGAGTGSAAPAVRDDMVRLAVQFLRDDKVRSAALAKKIAFLESKGLTQAEIDVAVQQAASPSAASLASSAIAESSVGPKPSVPAATYMAHPQYLQPQPAGWSGRDWVYAFGAAGALVGGLYLMINRWILPRLPNYNDLASAQTEFQRALHATSEAVDAVQADARAALAALRTDAQNLTTEAQAARKALQEVAEQANIRDQELSSIADDMRSLRENVPELIAEARDSSLKMIESLHADIKAMRTSVVSGGASAIPAASSSSPNSSTAAGDAIDTQPLPSTTASASDHELPPAPLPLGPAKVPKWQHLAAAAATAASSTSSPGKGPSAKAANGVANSKKSPKEPTAFVHDDN